MSVTARRGAAPPSSRPIVSCTAPWSPDRATHMPSPGMLLTDLAPDGCAVEWSQLRGWCEQGFTCTKRGGWPWQQTQMTDPRQAERLWHALAVAMFWMVCVGTELEVPAASHPVALPDLRSLLASPGRTCRLRLFRLGWLWLLVRAITALPVPVPRRLVPEPCPDVPVLLLPSRQHAKARSYASI
jgi:hypothetical protein